MADIIATPPEGAGDLVCYFKQSFTEGVTIDCHQQPTNRIEHRLTLFVQDWPCRLNVEAHYATDVNTAFLCSHQNTQKCEGGERQLSICLPEKGGASYLLGVEQDLVAYVCWYPDRQWPKFNLQVEVEYSASPAGAGAANLEETRGRFEFTLTGKQEVVQS